MKFLIFACLLIYNLSFACPKNKVLVSVTIRYGNVGLKNTVSSNKNQNIGTLTSTVSEDFGIIPGLQLQKNIGGLTPSLYIDMKLNTMIGFGVEF